MDTRASSAELDEVIQRYYAGLAVFLRGDPEPFMALFSQAEDVVLANPFGPAVRGWAAVSARLEDASSRFSDGELKGHDRLASYITADLATIFDVESGTVSVNGGPVSEWSLRTTTTFRREEGMWKAVHRHADPISTHDPEGPLRAS